ncbi:MAG: electron transport complex subunit E [Clostridia bacterium]|jgi:electron transport complex protein RnfE|nr:electron transport complex subunit E [Clostridia bacterium]
MKKTNYWKILITGLLKENPVFVLILGTCPTLAMSNSVTNAVGMGLAATAVLLCSNAVISLLRKVIPDSVRIPCYIVVIAGFVTLVEMFIHAFLPELYESLGVFLALITVNCIILGRAEMFAGKNTVGKSILDGIGMGLGFTIALLAMATVREVFGAGTFAGIEIPFMIDHKIEILVKAPGGLLVYGLLIAFVNVITKGKAIKKKEFNCAGCPSAGVCNGGCKANEVKEGE